MVPPVWREDLARAGEAAGRRPRPGGEGEAAGGQREQAPEEGRAAAARAVDARGDGEGPPRGRGGVEGGARGAVEAQEELERELLALRAVPVAGPHVRRRAARAEDGERARRLERLGRRERRGGGGAEGEGSWAQNEVEGAEDAALVALVHRRGALREGGLARGPAAQHRRRRRRREEVPHEVRAAPLADAPVGGVQADGLALVEAHVEHHVVLLAAPGAHAVAVAHHAPAGRVLAARQGPGPGPRTPARELLAGRRPREAHPLLRPVQQQRQQPHARRGPLRRHPHPPAAAAPQPHLPRGPRRALPQTGAERAEGGLERGRQIARRLRPHARDRLREALEERRAAPGAPPRPPEGRPADLQGRPRDGGRADGVARRPEVRRQLVEQRRRVEAGGARRLAEEVQQREVVAAEVEGAERAEQVAPAERLPADEPRALREGRVPRGQRRAAERGGRVDVLGELREGRAAEPQGLGVGPAGEQQPQPQVAADGAARLPRARGAGRGRPAGRVQGQRV